MALTMARAGREVVPATLHDEADVQSWTSDDVTIRLIRAVIAGCAAEPRLNASFDGANASWRTNAQIDLGLAIDNPDGLFVPVLRDVAGTSAENWRARINDLKQRVRDRTLAPAELRSPTITLSNFGTIAGRHAALMVVPPQVARSFARAALSSGRCTATKGWRCIACCRSLLSLLIIAPSLAATRRASCGPSWPISRNPSDREDTKMDDTFRFADAFGPSRIIHIHRPSVGLKAIVVVDNTSCGVAIGGVRMAPDVSTEECFRLARAMTWKNATAGLRHGGGKSVIFGNADIPVDEKERLIRAFAGAIRDITDYVPGPDMGTDELCMG